MQRERESTCPLHTYGPSSRKQLQREQISFFDPSSPWLIRRQTLCTNVDSALHCHRDAQLVSVLYYSTPGTYLTYTTSLDHVRASFNNEQSYPQANHYDEKAVMWASPSTYATSSLSDNEGNPQLLSGHPDTTSMIPLQESTWADSVYYTTANDAAPPTGYESDDRDSASYSSSESPSTSNNTLTEPINISHTFTAVDPEGRRPRFDIALITRDLTVFYVDESTLNKASSNGFNSNSPLPAGGGGKDERVVYLAELGS